MKSYTNIEAVVWAQEEPMNQGAWGYVKEALSGKIKIGYVGRERIPVPDTGSSALFHETQERVVREALG